MADRDTGAFRDQTIDKRSGPVLGGAHPFKLAVFSPNMAGGTNLTHAAGPPRVDWPEQVRIALAAERAGLDAVIPVARWRYPAPSADPRVHRSFEAFTWAAGIAAVTERIQVFATCHVPTMHPVLAAKEIATVDHISNGRFGLNVVAGWNANEFRMFDHTLAGHDDRYAIADEWMTFLERLFIDDQPFDVATKWFSSYQVVSEPRPVQRPGPVVMSAGFSPAGRAFAAKHADVNFVIVPDRETGRASIAETKAAAKDLHGRDLSIFTAAHILCRDSEAAARREYDRVVHEQGDWEGARHALELLVGGSQSADFDRDLAESAIFGFFATPLVGTPEQVVEMLVAMHEDGFDGAALSWVDYEEGLAQMDEVLRPMLIDAGLRV